VAHKEIRELIREIEANGFTVVGPGKGGHFKVKNAQGGTVYTLPGTPSGGRWKQNLRADLRRRGILP
jgi:predicted RNA binding protein YcfA (HicA-like mRNA interferase family)